MWILFLLLMTGLAQADVYVLTDQNNAVVGLSEQNDIVIPSGNKVTVIKGNISNLPISGDAKLYNFDKGSFTLNKSAVQAQQDAQKAAITKQAAQDNAKISAIGKLKGLGLTDDEVKAFIQ